MRYLFQFTWIILLFVAVASNQAQTEGASLDERGYGVYIPSSYDDNGENDVPLLIALHGFGDTWENFAPAHGFHLIAEQANLIVVTPQGYLRQWNDGSIGDHDEDDVQFLRDLVGRIQQDYRIDSERIYLAGLSNGGMMVYRAACEAPDLFAGIAAVGATMRIETYANCDEDAQLAVFMLHGTGDNVVPFYGDSYRIAVSDALVLWADRNGCNADVPEFDETYFYNNGYAVYLYDDCPDGNIVMLHVLQDVGHTWPGFDYYQRGTFHPQIQYDTARLIWGFFDYSYQLKTGAIARPEATPEATETADE